jgi:VanZ family protein
MKQNSYRGLHHRTAIKVILLLAAYGLMIEIMQETLTADRHFEWLDELANTSGAVIGTWITERCLSGKS